MPSSGSESKNSHTQRSRSHHSSSYGIHTHKLNQSFIHWKRCLCVCGCVSPCLSVCLSVCLCVHSREKVFVCLWVCLSMFVCVSVWVSSFTGKGVIFYSIYSHPHQFLMEWNTFSGWYGGTTTPLFVCVCLSVCICVCLWAMVCLYVWMCMCGCVFVWWCLWVCEWSVLVWFCVCVSHCEKFPGFLCEEAMK